MYEGFLFKLNLKNKLCHKVKRTMYILQYFFQNY